MSQVSKILQRCLQQSLACSNILIWQKLKFLCFCVTRMKESFVSSFFLVERGQDLRRNDESFKVWMRVLSIKLSASNENKSCMRVDESWQAKVCMRVFLSIMSWSNENKSCMRVDESWQVTACRRVFSTLMSWSNENKSCMRVDESWQARVCMRVDESWPSESLYESFLNSYVLVKREQELHESWWELTSESLYESFLNSHVLVKREQELMRVD